MRTGLARRVCYSLLLFLLGAVTGRMLIPAPGTLEPVLAEEATLTCPSTGKPLAPDWQYCPWHGEPVEAIRRGWVNVPSKNRTPKQAVVAFYEGLARQDGRELSAVLDVESIFTSLVAEGLAKQEKLPEGLREEIQKRIVAPAAGLLRFSLLDFATSPEIRQYFRVPEEVNADLLVKLYYEEIDGSTAVVGPSRYLRERGARSLLLRQDPADGTWRITEFPLRVAAAQ
jgi:hypothetical protein